MEKTLQSSSSSSSTDANASGNNCISPFKSLPQLLSLFACAFALTSLLRTFTLEGRVSELELMCRSYDVKIKEQQATLRQVREKFIVSPSSSIFLVCVILFIHSV